MRDQQCQKSEPESFKEVKISEKTNKQTTETCRIHRLGWSKKNYENKTILSKTNSNSGTKCTDLDQHEQMKRSKKSTFGREIPTPRATRDGREEVVSNLREFQKSNPHKQITEIKQRSLTSPGRERKNNKTQNGFAQRTKRTIARENEPRTQLKRNKKYQKNHK